MKPDFCVIGGMKCGTSTLAHQLSLQPGIFVTDPKEPNFFSDEDQFERGIGYYQSLFAGSEGMLRGEASTHYTKLPVHPYAAERFAAYAPEAKLVYMVRDPVSRAISHLRHAWTEREVTGDLEAAGWKLDTLWQYSCYDMQLARWLDHYDPSNVLVVALERLQTDPDGEFNRVLNFLGVGGAWVPDAESQNQGAARTRRLPMHDLIVNHPVAAAIRRALIPKSVRTAIRKARQLEAVELSDDFKGHIADKVREDIERFGVRFGIDGLTPEDFRARVVERQLSFAGTSDG